MNKHYLSPLFTPKSVAVFGASNTAGTVGYVVFENMLKSDFQGSLYPINPKYTEVQGKRAYASINEIHEPVELAVIATPLQTVPQIIENCGNEGVKAAIIMTAGFREAGGDLEEQLLATREPIRSVSSAQIALASCVPPLVSTLPFTRVAQTVGTLFLFPNPARSVLPFWIGPKTTMWAFRASCRWVRRWT